MLAKGFLFGDLYDLYLITAKQNYTPELHLAPLLLSPG